MPVYTVTGTRTKDDEQKRFTAPVVAANEEQAKEKFLDSVEKASEFNMVGVE